MEGGSEVRDHEVTRFVAHGGYACTHRMWTMGIDRRLMRSSYG